MNKWSLLARGKSTCSKESFSRNDTFCPHTEPVQANLDNGKIVPGSSTNCHLVPLCHVDAVLAMARNERNANERHFCSKICPQSCKEARKKRANFIWSSVQHQKNLSKDAKLWILF